MFLNSRHIHPAAVVSGYCTGNQTCMARANLLILPQIYSIPSTPSLGDSHSTLPVAQDQVHPSALTLLLSHCTSNGEVRSPATFCYLHCLHCGPGHHLLLSRLLQSLQCPCASFFRVLSSGQQPRGLDGYNKLHSSTYYENEHCVFGRRGYKQKCMNKIRKSTGRHSQGWNGNKEGSERGTQLLAWSMSAPSGFFLMLRCYVCD